MREEVRSRMAFGTATKKESDSSRRERKKEKRRSCVASPLMVLGERTV